MCDGSKIGTLCIINEQSKALDFNSAAETVFGYKYQGILGKNLLELTSPGRHIKTYKQNFDKLVKISQGKFIPHRVEIEVVHRDRREFIAEVSISKKSLLTNDSNGAVFVVFIRNLTERKLILAQIIQTSKFATLCEMAAWNSRRKISNGSIDPEYLNNKLELIEEQTTRATAIIDHMRMFGREAKESSEPVNPPNVVIKTLDLMGE